MRISQEADQCANSELGSLLRPQGLYSSHLSSWRRPRGAGRLATLMPKKSPRTESGRS